MRPFHPEGPTLAELAGQALSSIEEGYDRLAPKFDLTPFRTPDRIIERSLRDVGQVDRALDLCCGTGAASVRLMERARSVVGVDASRGMLEVAQGAAPSARFVQADALALPPDLRDFDLVVSYGAFGHFLPSEHGALVAEVHRVLRPGGRFVFVTSYPPGWSDPGRWIAHAFNGVMRVRNLVWRPPFVMYYLTFLLPEARRILEGAGFEVTIERGAFPDHPRLVNVIATL